MATVQEFILTKLKRFGIELSTVEMDSLLAETEVNGAATYTKSSSAEAKKAIVSIIPELLLQPDISEGGYSVKWDKDGVKAYYALLCAELGLPDTVNPAPKIQDRSYLW